MLLSFHLQFLQFCGIMLFVSVVSLWLIIKTKSLWIWSMILALVLLWICFYLSIHHYLCSTSCLPLGISSDILSLCVGIVVVVKYNNSIHTTKVHPKLIFSYFVRSSWLFCKISTSNRVVFSIREMRFSVKSNTLILKAVFH